MSCDTIQGRVWEREVTGLLDLECGGSVCRCGVCHATHARVGEGCGWLASLLQLKMKMVWERDVAGYRWRWINLISWFCYRSVSESMNYEGWESDLGARKAGVWTLGLRIRMYFFCIYSTPLNEPIRFDWGFSSFRFLKPKPNRTENFYKNFNRFF